MSRAKDPRIIDTSEKIKAALKWAGIILAILIALVLIAWMIMSFAWETPEEEAKRIAQEQMEIQQRAAERGRREAAERRRNERIFVHPKDIPSCAHSSNEGDYRAVGPFSWDHSGVVLKGRIEGCFFEITRDGWKRKSDKECFIDAPGLDVKVGYPDPNLQIGVCALEEGTRLKVTCKGCFD